MHSLALTNASRTFSFPCDDGRPTDFPAQTIEYSGHPDESNLESTSNRSFTQAILVLSALVFLVSCGGGSTPSSPPIPTLPSIRVSPQTATVAAELTQQQFTARGIYSDTSSHTLDAVTWSTSDNTVVTVNSTGLATTLKPGSATLTAASGTLANTAPLVAGPAIPVSLEHRTGGLSQRPPRFKAFTSLPRAPAADCSDAYPELVAPSRRAVKDQRRQDVEELEIEFDRTEAGLQVRQQRPRVLEQQQ
jgi:hypothetical protein